MEHPHGGDAGAGIVARRLMGIFNMGVGGPAPAPVYEHPTRDDAALNVHSELMQAMKERERFEYYTNEFDRLFPRAVEHALAELRRERRAKLAAEVKAESDGSLG